MSVKDILNDSGRLDEAIGRLFTRMSEVECDTKEYASMVDQAVKLYKLLEIAAQAAQKDLEIEGKLLETQANSRLKDVEAELKQKELDDPKRVSLDTWAIIGSNLAGIVLILGYEKANVVTSKALGFVMKLR